MNEIIIPSLSSLPAAANEFIQLIGDRRIISFSGQMGAGKTTFIKAICEAMGVKDTISSPTFSLVNEYRAGAQKIYHFDFYRIRTESEAYDMGYEDYFYSGAYCFIEWPEKISALLPDEAVRVNISIEGDQRRISINL